MPIAKEKKVASLVVNKIATHEIYNKMSLAGMVNEDEIYVIEEALLTTKDSQILDLLIEDDMLIAVTSDNYILTDEQGNILQW